MKINSSVAANSYLLDAVTNNIDYGTSVRSSSLHSVRSIIMKLMLVMMIVGGWNVARGQSTVTITVASSGISGAPYQSSTFVQNGVTFGYTNWLKSTNIQAKASTTNSLYNVTAFPGKILNITFKQTGTARSITVYGGTSSQPTSSIASPATAATMTFDFSSYNYTFFSMKTPGNACYFDEIIITYESAPLTPCRVDFNFGAGHSSTTPATTSLIEASAGAGITLPSAIAPAGCDPEYTFFGWATSTVNETMTAPIVVGIAGQTYHPSENITLYAVYKQINREEIIVTYDFSDIPEFDAWGTSYSSHEVEYREATVTFENANHQSSGTLITDIPVTKGDDVFVVMNNATQYIKEATFVCRQWGTKTQTITLSYSTNGGSSYTSTGTTSTNFTISNNNLPAGTNAVKISFSNSSNQVGIESCTIKNPSIITYNSNPSCVPCEADPAISATALNFSDITASSVTVEAPGGITSFGENCHIRSYGFVYGTSANPTLASGTVAVAGTSYTTINSSFNKIIDGLSPCTTYHVRAYATNGHGTVYGSDCTFTTGSDAEIIVSYNNIGETSTALTWNLSGTTCASGHYVVICKEGNSNVISSCDNYDFRTVVANAALGSGSETQSGEYAVYSGSGTSVTITNLTPNTTYIAAVFYVDDNGICMLRTQIAFGYFEETILEPGDMAIIAVNNHIVNGDAANTADEFSFMIFKRITPGTAIDMTDNGYERNYEGFWGTKEGFWRITRKNYILEPGSVITVNENEGGIGYVGSGGVDPILGSNINIYVNGNIDNSNWSIEVDGPLNLNARDQIWIMQGGEWNVIAENKAEYTGNVLYGFTATGWKTSVYNDNEGSTIYPGCDCFISTLNIATGISKYKGPFTEVTKREWIMRINDEDNWGSASGEDAYTSANYITKSPYYKDEPNGPLGNNNPSYPLPIAPGDFTQGKWNGKKDSNWCNCANWMSLVVPDETVDVEIPDVGSDNEVEIFSGDTALCKTLTITSLGQFRSTQNNSALKVAGNITVNTNGTFSPTDGNDFDIILGGNITNSGTFITNQNTSLTLTGESPQSISAPSSGGNQKLKNLTLSSEANIFDADTIELYGNLRDNSASHLGFDLPQALTFRGTSSQTSTSTAITDITMNKSSNNLTLSGMITVNGQAKFVNGNIVGNVTFSASATSAGASTNSYVDGTVTKKANASAFTFPTGSNGVLGALEVNSLDADTDLKFNHEPDGFDASEMPVWWNQNNMCGPNEGNAKFDHVTDMYFWNLGSSSPMEDAVFTVTADDDIHFNVATVEHEEPDIAMAIYDGCWKNLGGTASTNATSYTYISISDVDLPATRAGGDKIVTFGSIDHNTLLPIELVAFSAECKGSYAKISWTTATERNNDYFVLERSSDAINFDEVARLAGAGNSINPVDYTYNDYSVHGGDSYYRLVQVDYDGTRTVSEMIAVNCTIDAEGAPEVVAYPNPFGSDLTLRFENFGNMPASVEVYDMLGRLVMTTEVQCTQNEHEVVLHLETLPDATYNVRVSTAEFVINRKVVKE